MGKTAAGAVWLNAEQLSRLRLLAVLAQHRGRRRRPLPEALHRRCRSDEIAKLAALQGAEINEAKKVLATEATALLHGREKARGGRRDGAQDLRAGRARRGPADGRDRRRRTGGGARRAGGVRAGGPRQVERRGAAADPGRRLARQRRRGDRREAAKLTPSDVTRRRRSSSRSAGSGTCC